MIRTFADKRTKAVFEDVPVKGLGPDIRRAARKKLLMLDRAGKLADLRVPPGNRLEALQGGRAGAAQHPGQRSVADLFRLARQGRLRGRDCGLSLRTSNYEHRA